MILTNGYCQTANQVLIRYWMKFDAVPIKNLLKLLKLLEVLAKLRRRSGIP